jgi:hypothetical protein
MLSASVCIIGSIGINKSNFNKPHQNIFILESDQREK